MMATLESIGFTLASASALGFFSICAFGLAVSYQSIAVAPRAMALPRSVIYNPKPEHSSQDRGNPMLGWIPWTLGLTYDSMLQGVPGTGTRDGGLSGRLLKVNLDGIVLLRFHALGMRITGFVTVLCLLILLPLYYTAGCYDNSDLKGCNATVTNYERTTLANVPSNFIKTDQNRNVVVTYEYKNVMGIMYTIVVVYWLIVAYTFYQLQKEWIEVLVMRRVYYLEHDVWENRKEELKETLLYRDMEKRKRAEKKHFTFEEADKLNRRNRTTSVKDGDDDIFAEREPWVPHPEIRDTVSNVALYSVLVGSLPSLLQQAADRMDCERGQQMSKRDSVDWQLMLTAAFFDHCIPNQPGFSSSVAAVTIMPSSRALSNAWSKWYAAAAKLRRLRFIRQLIAEKKHYEIEVEGEEREEEANRENSVHVADQSDQFPAIAPTDSIYENPEKYTDYYRAVLGILDENDSAFEFLSFGPEQASAYSREFAQAAGPCCPRGWGEGRLRKAGIDELLELEKEAAEEVHEANFELKKAREKATFLDGVDEDKNGPDSSEKPEPSKSNPSIATSTQSMNSTKRHRRQFSVEGKKMPSHLQLEARIYENQAKRRKETGSFKNFSDHSSKHTNELRESIKSATAAVEESPAPLEEWDLVKLLVKDHVSSSMRRSERSSKAWEVASGQWEFPTLKRLLGFTKNKLTKASEWTKATPMATVESLARDSTYAVVTFTSRQAAVAARSCLADGRGVERWVALSDIPIPPLADASACDILNCRNCCRPLALGVNERQKICRNHITVILLGFIYTLYTVPLTYTSKMFEPDDLKQLAPELTTWSDNLPDLLSGFMNAYIFSTFYSLCPALFKAIANFGSNATSVASAEFKALQYYWWFMVFVAFSSQILASMVFRIFKKDLSIASELRGVVTEISKSVPSSEAYKWLNWIIYRIFAVLPSQYLLQMNTFIFSMLRMDCCARILMGGGPGGPCPYRIYVDSGVVLMCSLALAPASPLVAPACLVYFVACQPILRRNHIFVYRPMYDGGGLRWPFIFDMFISGLVVGTILLWGQLALKEALAPSVLVLFTLIPIYFFERAMKRRFLRAFNDAALLQTSLKDGWNTEGTSMRYRQEFRRFLVDAHKAAYVPVCLASPDTEDCLTAEPAVVVPLETDPDREFPGYGPMPSEDEPMPLQSPDSGPPVLQRRNSQLCATLRRISMASPRYNPAGSTRAQLRVSCSDEDDLSILSPFEYGLTHLSSVRRPSRVVSERLPDRRNDFNKFK